MNVNYKVVWNEALGCFTAVSELATSQGKKSSKSVAAVVAATLMMLGSGQASAEERMMEARDYMTDCVVQGLQMVCIDGAKSLTSGSFAVGQNSLAGQSVQNYDVSWESLTAPSTQTITIYGAKKVINAGDKFSSPEELNLYLNRLRDNDKFKRTYIGKMNNIAMGTGAQAVGGRNISIGESAGAVADDTNLAYLNSNESRNIKNQLTAVSAEERATYNWQIHNVNIGTNAGLNAKKDYSIAMGFNAGALNEAARKVQVADYTDATVFIGKSAGENNTSSGSVAIGVEAAMPKTNGGVTDKYDDQSVYIGKQAGRGTETGVLKGADGNGTYKDSTKTYLGIYRDTNDGLLAGSLENPGSPALTGINVGVGPNALWFAKGSANVGMGWKAGNSSTGSNNTYLGNISGMTQVGDFNVAVGNEAGGGAVSSRSVSVGSYAKANGDTSVAVGSGAKAGSQDKTLTVTSGSMNSSGAHYQNNKYNDIAVGNEAAATGGSSIAMGKRAISNNDSSVAVGSNAEATGKGAISLGSSVGVTVERKVEGYGENTDTAIPEATKQSIASGDFSMALGTASAASGNNSIAQGTRSSAKEMGSIALGYEALSTGDASLAASSNAKAYGKSDIAIGKNALAGDENFQNSGGYSYNTAIGQDARATAFQSTAIGTAAKAVGGDAVAVGSAAHAADTAAIAVGKNSLAQTDSSLAVGKAAQATGTAAVAVGGDAIASGNNATVFGVYSKAEGASSTAVGPDAQATKNNAVAVGVESRATGGSSVATGHGAQASGGAAIAIGHSAQATANNAISIGNGNIVSGKNSGAIGDPSTVSGTGSYSIGNDNTVATNDSFVLGSNVTQTVTNSVALGKDSAMTAGTAAGTKVKNATGALGTTTTAGDKGSVASATINTISYGGFAGATADGVVSVGSAGKERRIQNVAAGEISATSTDAINGSQLHQVAAGLQTHYYHVNTTGNPNYNNDGATGKNSMAAGKVTASGENSLAVGIGAAAKNINSISIGKTNIYGDNAIGLGSGYAAAKNAIVIGNGAVSDNMGPLSEEGIAIGTNAKSLDSYSTQPRTIFGFTIPSMKPNALPNGVGGIAIGANTYANQGTIDIGMKKATGPHPAAPSKTIVGSEGRGANRRAVTSVGTESYAAAHFSSIFGSYSSITSDASVQYSGLPTQGFASSITGTLNTIKANSPSTQPAAAFDGMANAINGTANVIEHSNGALIMGAGNKISNSLLPVSISGLDYSMASDPEAFNKKLNTPDSNGVKPALASVGIFGGANEVDNSHYVNVSGVDNQLKGEAEGASSEFVSIDGYMNRATNVKHLSEQGSHNEVTNAEENIVMGNYNKVLGDNVDRSDAKRNVVLGFQDKDANKIGKNLKNSQVIGSNVTVAENTSNGVLIGDDSRISSSEAIAIGHGAQALANKAISIGTGNKVTGEGSGAIGDPTTVSGTGSYSIGNNNTVATNDSFVLGSNVSQTIENSVALGKDSAMTAGSAVGTAVKATDGTDGATTTAGDKGTVDTATVNGVTYGGFAGATADGVVSVGSAGKERRVQNVAAGEISETSTDAINGSQLYLVAKGLNDQMPVVYTKADGTKVYKKPDGTFVDESGTEVQPTDVIASMNNGEGSTTAPMALTNIAGNLDGAKANTTAPVTSGTAPAAEDINVNNAATVGDVLNAGWNLQGNGQAVDFVKPYDTVNFVDGANTTVSVTTADNLTNEIRVNVTNLPISYTNEAGDTLVKVGDNFYKASDVVDGKPKDDAAPQTPAGTTLVDSTGAAAPQTLDNVQSAINPDGSKTGDAFTTALNEAATNDPNKAVNVSDLKNATTTIIAKGTVYSGDVAEDNDNAFTRALGEETKVIGGVTDKTKLSDNNIGVVSNGTDTLTVKLAKDLKDLNSATFGTDEKDQTVINKDGITIKGDNNVSLTDAGLDNGGNKITNVAEGTADTDAVNVSQLNKEVAKAKTTVTSNDGSVTVAKTTASDGHDNYDLSVNAQSVAENAQLPVVYTNKAGDKVYKQADGTFNTAKDGSGDTVKPADVIASMNNGEGSTTAPMALTNIAGNLDGAKANTTAPVTSGTAPAAEDINVNNAATVGDVLNAGWNLQGSGQAVGFVKPYDTVNFVGTGAATVTGEVVDGVATITIDVPKTAAGGMNSFNVASNGAAPTEIADGNTVDFIDGNNTVVTTTPKADNSGVDVKVDLADNIMVGKPGVDGKDGSIGATGKDGASAVLNGKDGTIGLTGPRGADGEDGASAAIGVKDGAKGLDGNDGANGDSKTRIVYTTPDGNTEEVATLNDGLKFEGNQGGTLDKKLNETVTIKGDLANDKDATAANTRVDVEDGNLVVKLAKDITDVNSVTFGPVDPATGKPADPSKTVSIGSDGLNNGGNQITNVASGGDVDTNAANIGDVKKAAAAAKTTVSSNDSTVKVVKSTDKDTGADNYDLSINAQGVTNNAQLPVVYTNKAGDKVYKQADGTFNTAKDGTGDTVQPADVIASMNNGENETAPTQLANVASAIDPNGDSKDFAESLDKAAADPIGQNSAVNVSDLKKAADTLTNKGFGLTDENGNAIQQGLGTAIKVQGNNGITTSVVDSTDKDGQPVKALEVSLGNDITVGGLGKDGQPGKDGTIGVKGADGQTGVTLNGKDGTIGLNGKDGANGTLSVAKGEAGVNGKDGETKDRLKVNGEDVATLEDGLKYAGDQGTAAVKLNKVTNVVGGAKGDLTDNNIGVVASQDGDNAKLTVKLAKELKGLNSVETVDANGNTTVVNGGGVTITPANAPADKAVSLTTGGLNNGGNRITNVAPGVDGTDAVNVNQLNEALKNVNVDLRPVHQRIDDIEKDSHAGVAQALATAGLPQAYLPGKSMMAIGTGYYKGQTGYAIGFSTISDGGNWIIKATGSGNSRGNFGASVGAGYQW